MKLNYIVFYVVGENYFVTNKLENIDIIWSQLFKSTTCLVPSPFEKEVVAK